MRLAVSDRDTAFNHVPNASSACEELPSARLAGGVVDSAAISKLAAQRLKDLLGDWHPLTNPDSSSPATGQILLQTGIISGVKTFLTGLQQLPLSYKLVSSRICEQIYLKWNNGLSFCVDWIYSSFS